MTATPPPAGWSLDPAREQEIRDQYAELGTSTDIEAAVGPYSVLGDLLAEIARLRAELADARNATLTEAAGLIRHTFVYPNETDGMDAAADLLDAARTPTR